MTPPRSSSEYAFPPVEAADDEGLLAYGGDLSAERLISAYESGIFPWFNEGQPILWWSPPQRMVLYPMQFKLQKSLRQVLRSGKFDVKIDQQFNEVIQRCAAVKRKGQSGTWITPEMMTAYQHLHQLGLAHSFECYRNGDLVGGLYGVSLGRVFFGESMFSQESNASKVAFHALVDFAERNEFHFIDCQLYTEHLAFLGAEEIERAEFLKELKEALAYPDIQREWS